MTRIQTATTHFRCRVAGVMLHQDHVLLQGEPGSPIWILPGGGIELLESSPGALQREMHEELGLAIKIKRLLWVIESFFVHRDKSSHEIGFYFLIEPVDVSDLLNLDPTFTTTDSGITIIFRWFHIEQLTELELYPAFLKTALRTLPPVPEHIILDEF